jgi:hypothetical protein
MESELSVIPTLIVADVTWFPRVGLLLILGFLGSMVACGLTTTAATPESVVVSVTPSSASVPVSQTAQFNVSVQNDSQNKGVTWTLTQSGISCSPACGMVSTAETSATYHAPANVPQGSTVVLTATSLADSTKSGSAQITVSAQAPSAISVSLVPISASVPLSQTQPFTAAVQNDSQNEGVTWTLTQSGAACAPACGSIIGSTSQTAIYSSPAGIINPPTVTITATSLADGTRSASATITVGAVPPVNNVSQWIAVTSFGGRAVTSVPTTTATCTSGLTTVALASDPGFQNGDGLTLWACGPTAALSQPGPPTVTTGDSVTETVPNAVLAPSAGLSSYGYKIIAADNAGGFSPVSTPTTIITGPATLGENSCPVSSESLSGSTLTVVTSAHCNLLPGTLVHIHGSNLAALDQWIQVSSVTNPTTFVFNNLALSGTMASKGGTLVYWTGNQLTWKGQQGTWLYGICAERPGDDSYHLIGISLPYVEGLPSSTTFTDWGTTLTTFPAMPAYWTDSLCTNTSRTADYLSTIIFSGAGTTSLVVTDAASNSTNDTTALFDEGPAFRAAAKFAAGYHEAVFIPTPTDPSAHYPINSYTNMLEGTSVIQSGPIAASETIQAPTQWTGPSTTAGALQFAQKSTPVIGCYVSPCFYISGGTPYVDGVQLTGGGNQAYVMIWDGGGQGGQLNNLNIATGVGGTDYSGIGLIVRYGAFFVQMQHVTIIGGPHNGIEASLDQSWTPQEYFCGDPNMAVGGEVSQDYVAFNSRTAYVLNYGGNAGGEFQMSDAYAQGGLMPLLATQNVNDNIQPLLYLANFVQDTSAEPLMATWGSLNGGGNTPQIVYAGTTGLSVDTGGMPPFITGNAPASISLPSSYVLPTGGGQYVNVSAQPMSVTTGTQSNTTEFAVGLAQPVISSVTISQGGTFPVESGNLCVNAVGWNGGWSAPACIQFQTTSGNQTITVTLAGPVQGAKGYIMYTGEGRCFTPGGKGCIGQITTAGTSYTQSTDPGCCSQIPTNNYPTDGSSWISGNGVGGPQLTTYNGQYDDTIEPGGLTANQTLTEPNASGTIALSGSSGISAGSISISGATSGIYTFLAPYPSAPNCVVSPSATSPAPASLTYDSSSSPSGVTVTLASPGTAKFNFVCYPPTN